MPGTWVCGFQIDIASIRSLRLPLTVTPMRRVCGTGIGMECTHVTFLTLKRSIRPRTASVKASQRKSGSKPDRKRNGWRSSS